MLIRTVLARWLFLDILRPIKKQKDQPPTAGLENFFLRCLLKRVKTQLRVPKMQRATFLNNIVTVNTDFS
ncbi:hypothetical protein NIES4072_47690 [Nostoc commune NIES-4072]|uniref:Uncharacterized protein n=1 Tax=Nostoc commune NIES-4072 TaxID=2005467 RepID=A0A2R5FQR3_NOSCO|nr:hypothetical protein NIES4070_43230 [Nostoc commune HK-02]GBG21087.1 hypothetical protein NIES4072_47690 [Nostoc commune NIES-4072]